MNESSEGDDLSFVKKTPGSGRKKKLLKPKLTGPTGKKMMTLNSSRLHANRSLNHSMVKQTLRNNNRELARALQIKKRELKNLGDQVVELHASNQALRQEVGRLNNVAGLLDSQIQQEVDARVEAQKREMHESLHQATSQLAACVDTLHALGIKFHRDRQSSTSPLLAPLRTIYNKASLPEPPERTTTQPDREKAVYTVPQDSAVPSGSGEFDNDIVTEAPLPPAHLSCVPDLSMVMEQSQLLDSFQLPFTEEEETGNQTKKVHSAEFGMKRSGSRRTIRRSQLLYSSMEGNEKIEKRSTRSHTDVSTGENHTDKAPVEKKRATRLSLNKLDKDNYEGVEDITKPFIKTPSPFKRSGKTKRTPQAQDPCTQPFVDASQSSDLKLNLSQVTESESTNKRNSKGCREIPTFLAVTPPNVIKDNPATRVSNQMTRSPHRVSEVTNDDGTSGTRVTRAKRGTFVLEKPVVLPVSDDEGILDQDPSVLIIDSDADNATARSPVNHALNVPVAAGTINSLESTICQVQDMDLTEVIRVDPSLLQLPASTIICPPSPQITKSLHITKNISVTIPPSSDEIQHIESEQNCEWPELPICADDEAAAHNVLDENKHIESNHISSEEIRVDDLSEEVGKKDQANQSMQDKDSEAMPPPPPKPIHKKPNSKLSSKLKNGKEVASVSSRKSSRSKKAINYVTDDDDDVWEDTASVASSDGESSEEGSKKKFSAVLEKPGKIKFTAGKLDDDSKVRTKSHSLLPKVKPKSRSKQKQSQLSLAQTALAHGSEPSIFNFKGTPRGVDKDKKDVFDCSLNESVNLTKSTTYNEYCEKKTGKARSKGRLNDAPQLSAAEEVTAKTKSMALSPHGIMLVLGNGKRTKQRARAKSVCIMGDTLDDLPAAYISNGSESASEMVASSDEMSPCDVSTPDVPPTEKPATKQVVLVPESPCATNVKDNSDVDEGHRNPTRKRRPTKIMDLTLPDSDEEWEANKNTKVKKKSKLSLAKVKPRTKPKKDKLAKMASCREKMRKVSVSSLTDEVNWAAGFSMEEDGDEDFFTPRLQPSKSNSTEVKKTVSEKDNASHVDQEEQKASTSTSVHQKIKASPAKTVKPVPKSNKPVISGVKKSDKADSDTEPSVASSNDLTLKKSAKPTKKLPRISGGLHSIKDSESLKKASSNKQPTTKTLEQVKKLPSSESAKKQTSSVNIANEKKVLSTPQSVERPRISLDGTKLPFPKRRSSIRINLEKGQENKEPPAKPAEKTVSTPRNSISNTNNSRCTLSIGSIDGDGQGRRSRRTAAPASYKEVSLTKKMRREDATTKKASSKVKDKKVAGGKTRDALSSIEVNRREDT